MKSYAHLKKQLLKDRATHKAYEDLGPEFARVQEMIAQRIVREVEVDAGVCA